MFLPSSANERQVLTRPVMILNDRVNHNNKTQENKFYLNLMQTSRPTICVTRSQLREDCIYSNCYLFSLIVCLFMFSRLHVMSAFDDR